MLSVFLVFLFLFALIHFCERDRDDLDGFTIATAVIVPVLIVIVLSVLGGFLGFGSWLPIAQPVCLAIATYLVLTLNLEIKRIRAVWYTVAVLVFHFLVNFGIGVIFAVLSS